MSERETIYLCLAHMSEEGWEQKYIKEAFDTNWVVPMGPNVSAFEADLKKFLVAPKPPKGGVLGSADPAYYEELKERAQRNRNNPTQAEDIVWGLLSGQQLEGYKFRRQHIIGQYIADFVCLERMLIIEIDGGYHNNPTQAEDDKIREEWLKSQGYRVIRFSNDEVIASTDSVVDSIYSALNAPFRGEGGWNGSIVALSAGTAAIHLALIAAGVKAGDEVCVQSFTFCASSHPITYIGAKPVFIGSEEETWNMDPELLEKAILDRKEKTGKYPKAIIPVALYGMPYQIDKIMAIADKYGIPVIEDAAEGMGSRFNGQVLGTFGKFGALSFNGNKMITTSGGGALICRDAEDANTIMWYATQARDAYPYYQHTAIGYNYRMSNVCAGIGRGQMTVLDDHIAHHKHVQSLYEDLMKDIPGVQINKQPKDSKYDSNYWLCTMTLNPSVKVKGQENAYKEVIKGAVGGAAGVIHAVDSPITDCQPNDNVEAMRVFMQSKKVECRPVWKPMHKQPVYTDAPVYTNGVEEDIFKVGMCLPAGPYVTDDDVRYIVDCIKEAIAE